MANEIIAAWHHNDHLDLSEFLAKLPKKMADQVSRTYGRPHTEEDEAARQRFLFDCVMKIRGTQRKLGKEQLLRELREAEQRGDEVAVRFGLQRLKQSEG